jgi:signal transduction histidine kinase
LDRTRAEQPRTECAKAKVLVVDDDPIVRELACAQLGTQGHDAVSADDGVDAWEILVSQNFELAIVDLDMPRMNGFELIEKMRASAAHRFIPIMVVTAMHDTPSIERAFAVGATTFVTKPLNWPLFGHEVRYVLRAAELERELREARDGAEQLVAQKDSFLTVMSHELRTPLNAIIGFAELLASQPPGSIVDRNHRSYLDEILNGGRRLLGSLQDISVYARLLAGDLALNEGDYPLEALEAAIRGHVANRAQEEGVHLAVTGLDGAATIQCDLRLLGRALAALVDNAVKFSPPGGEVRIEADVSRDGRLTIAVRDHGPGMSPEEIARDLAPFTQSDMSLRRSAEGLGLGLTIANALVRLHGGDIAFDSAMKGGTIVRIALPRSRVRGAA